jgi:hypothetical protein
MTWERLHDSPDYRGSFDFDRKQGWIGARNGIPTNGRA